MPVNTQKSKVMIFQKQCGKSILEKHSFFLDDLQIDNVPSYSYLGSTISSNGSFTISKQKSVEKTRRSIFATKRFLDYCKFPLKICNKLFDSLFLPILLYNSEVWGAYDNTNLQIWEKDPVERLHSQFFKYYLGLNKRAPNVAARNEVGRLSLKSRIYRNVLHFWLHLRALPDDNIARQCQYISENLALSHDQSFMNSINTLLIKYNHTTSTSFSITNKNPNSLKQCVHSFFEYRERLYSASNETY